MDKLAHQGFCRAKRCRNLLLEADSLIQLHALLDMHNLVVHNRSMWKVTALDGKWYLV